MSIEIWCDGSSNGRTGSPTGWAYIIIKDMNILYSDHGTEIAGTNQTAELTAAIEGIKAFYLVKETIWLPGEPTILISDSMYTLNNAQRLYNPQKNVNLVYQLQDLYDAHCTGVRWVKGHAGNTFNEIVDKLAKKGRQKGDLLKRGL